MSDEEREEREALIYVINSLVRGVGLAEIRASSDRLARVDAIFRNPVLTKHILGTLDYTPPGCAKRERKIDAARYNSVARATMRALDKTARGRERNQATEKAIAERAVHRERVEAGHKLVAPHLLGGGEAPPLDWIHGLPVPKR